MSINISKFFAATSLSLALGMISSCGGSGGNGAADADADGDGVVDSLDAFPNDPAETVDTDGDGTGNNADTDDDADGVNDDIDQFPLDTDNDGLDNTLDDDDDEDGVADPDDAFPLDSSESMDTDGDGIGDNADPDPTGDNGDVTEPDPVGTITTGTNPAFACIDPPNAPAAFVGMFTGTLEANYNIGNSTGCGGLGTGDSYSISFSVPDPGDVGGGDAVFMFSTGSGGSIPTVVENAEASSTITLPVTETRGGIFESANCSITITEVSALGGQAGGELYFVDGSVTCDPLTLSILFSPTTGEQADIVFTQPLMFRGAVGVPDGL